MQCGRKTGDHWLYIKIQHYAGRNLADCPSVPSRTMELSRMLKIFVQIASALMHVHSCRLIDRDLKPANIVVADVEREMRLLGGFGLLRDVANASSLNVATSLDYFLTRACFQWSAEHSFVNAMWSNMLESNVEPTGVVTLSCTSPKRVAEKVDRRDGHVLVRMILLSCVTTALDDNGEVHQSP